MNRGCKGVTGIRLSHDDEVAGIVTIPKESEE